MYGKILLPVENIESAGLAISNAKQIVGSGCAEVILFHVVSPETPPVMLHDHIGGVQAAAELFEVAQCAEAKNVEDQTAIIQITAEELSSAGLSVSSQVVVGKASVEIVRAVLEQEIDLVIISTRGRRGVSRAFLGSVADEVMRDVDIPVMVVRRS
ncbi:MAG: universal stress protein [Chloroflexi bacterium]|nr:universal stress protein [Chloroflexota bacterium]